MRATIYPIESAGPYRLAIVARPRGGDWLNDELAAFSREGVDVLVSMLVPEEAQELGLQREEEECAAAAITFVSVPISDRSSQSLETISYAELTKLPNLFEKAIQLECTVEQASDASQYSLFPF